MDSNNKALSEALHVAEMSSIGVASSLELYLYFYRKNTDRHPLTRQCQRQVVKTIETFLMDNPKLVFDEFVVQLDTMAEKLYHDYDGWDASEALDEVVSMARRELEIPE